MRLHCLMATCQIDRECLNFWFAPGPFRGASEGAYAQRIAGQVGKVDEQVNLR